MTSTFWKWYEYSIKAICLLLPVAKRSKVREQWLLLPVIYEKNNRSIPYFKKFRNYIVPSKCVLIVEPNHYHFEILPGFCQYFKELGYDVHLISQPALLDDSPFIRCSEKPETFYLSPKYQKKALAHKKIKQYDWVFFSTSVLWEKAIRDSYPNWLSFLPQSKYGVLMVEHNLFPYVEQYGHKKFIAEHRTFTLAGQHNVPMLNPHYFGGLSITPKGSKTTFSAVIHHEQNKDILFEACRKLITSSQTHFRVIILGRSVVKDIPADLLQHIEVTGKIKFSEFWAKYDQTDFIMTMLNPEIPAEQKYRNGTTTGSWQLMMGFRKPVLIHTDFADFYRLHNENAILYQQNEELAETMSRCIAMTDPQYEAYQRNIKALASEIHEESLHNLRKVITQHEGNSTFP